MNGAAPRRLLRLVAAVFLAEALLALEIEPGLPEGPAGALALPGLGGLIGLAAALASTGLAILCASLPGRGVSRVARALAPVGALLAWALLFASTPFSHFSYHLALAALNAMGLLAILLLGIHDARGWANASTQRKAIARALVFPLVLLAAEAVFTLTPVSHAVGYTLSSRLWFERYWSPPRNTLGYRDSEHVDDGRRKLFVLGDSFVAGIGIENVADRFTDRLQERVAGWYRVYNLGKNGSDTSDEYERLLAHPLRPDVLVLAYYVNDVTGAARRLGEKPPAFTPYANLPGWLGAIVRRSYLLDFLYWRLPQPDLRAYNRFLERCFEDSRIVAIHREELERIVACCRERRVPLLVVAFPHLADPLGSHVLLNPALDVFERNAIPVVDVALLAKDLDPRRITVNRNDGHPNEEFAAILADEIYGRLEAMRLLGTGGSR